MQWHLLPVYLIDEYLLILHERLKAFFIHTPPEAWNNGNRGDVLLLPGLHENWIGMEKIGNMVNSCGYRVHVLEKLGINTMPVTNGSQLAGELILERNLRDVTIITHSKGGLIACYMLHDPHISGRIRKVITLACPFYGSKLAAVFPSSKELVPKTPVIKNVLAKADITKIVNIYPSFDNHVFPNSSLILPGGGKQKNGSYRPHED